MVSPRPYIKMQKIICTDNMKVEVNLFQETKGTIVGGAGQEKRQWDIGMELLEVLHIFAQNGLIWSITIK